MFSAGRFHCSEQHLPPIVVTSGANAPVLEKSWEQERRNSDASHDEMFATGEFAPKTSRGMYPST
jgi:hypothetical protein